MKIIRFDASKKQLSRLRNGHKVRIKPAISGKGFCMIVDAGNYNIATRSFGRGKGVELALSPEEILANQQERGQMEGDGIFDDIKKGAKAVGKVVAPVAKQVGRAGLKELSKGADKLIDMGVDYAPELLSGALTAGAVALGQPELVPVAGMVGNVAGKQLGKLAGKEAKKQKDKLVKRGDDALAPKKKAGNKGATTSNQRARLPNTRAGAEMYDRSLGEMNELLGTNYGYMGRAGLAGMDYIQLQALADQARQAQMNRPTTIDDPNRGSFNSNQLGNRGSMRWVGGSGEGLYAGKQGRGIYAGRGFRASGGQIGGRGARQLPPALQSQPFSANFQFGATLPPQYQHIHKTGQ
jgi:hypothetical protein